MVLSCTSKGDVGAQNASMSLAFPLYLGRSPSKVAQVHCLQWRRVLGFKGVRVYCQTWLGIGVGIHCCKPVAGYSDSRTKNRVVVAASSQEGSVTYFTFSDAWVFIFQCIVFSYHASAMTSFSSMPGIAKSFFFRTKWVLVLPILSVKICRSINLERNPRLTFSMQLCSEFAVFLYQIVNLETSAI